MEIVHDIPEGAPIINIEGKKGESLFSHPVIWFMQEDFERVKQQFERYQKLIEGTQEERLLALIGALSMEEALDLFLGKYITNYKFIEENRDFSLSMKIDVAYSLCLIPKHILDATDMIRKVRNEFAHDLSIDCFDSLKDDKFKTRLTIIFKELFPNDKNVSLTVKGMFIAIVETVIIGLGVYALHLRAAEEYIYSLDFAKQLVERIKAKSGKI